MDVLSSIWGWFTVAHVAEVVAITSALSNLVPPHTLFGKALHFVSLNLSNIFHLPGSGGPGTK